MQPGRVIAAVLAAVALTPATANAATTRTEQRVRSGSPDANLPPLPERRGAARQLARNFARWMNCLDDHRGIDAAARAREPQVA